MNMKSPKYLILIVIFSVNMAHAEYQNKAVIQELIMQLNGEKCVYHSYDIESYETEVGISKLANKKINSTVPCNKIPYPAWWNLLGKFKFNNDERWDMRMCQYWAAKCLGAFGENAKDALPTLKVVERTANNKNTGDGGIPTITAVSEAISKIEQENH